MDNQSHCRTVWSNLVAGSNNQPHYPPMVSQFRKHSIRASVLFHDQFVLLLFNPLPSVWHMPTKTVTQTNVWTWTTHSFLCASLWRDQRSGNLLPWFLYVPVHSMSWMVLTKCRELNVYAYETSIIWPFIFFVLRFGDACFCGKVGFRFLCVLSFLPHHSLPFPPFTPAIPLLRSFPLILVLPNSATNEKPWITTWQQVGAKQPTFFQCI